MKLTYKCNTISLAKRGIVSLIFPKNSLYNLLFYAHSSSPCLPESFYSRLAPLTVKHPRTQGLPGGNWVKAKKTCTTLV